MATAKANHLQALSLYVIRAALAEAKLMTEKHARDAVYVATLAEELRSIEVKISSMEGALQLCSLEEDTAVMEKACHAPQTNPDANWIRSKSGELSRRLRRVGQCAQSK